MQKYTECLCTHKILEYLRTGADIGLITTPSKFRPDLYNQSGTSICFLHIQYNQYGKSPPLNRLIRIQSISGMLTQVLRFLFTI